MGRVRRLHVQQSYEAQGKQAHESDGLDTTDGEHGACVVNLLVRSMKPIVILDRLGGDIVTPLAWVRMKRELRAEIEH